MIGDRHTTGAPAGTPPRRTTFADAARAELVKIRTTRSTAYTLLATIALGVGFSVLFSLGAGHRYASSTPARQAGFDPTAASLASHIVAQLAVGVLGVLVITSEYASGMIRTSLAAVPRRSRLLAAKATVFTAIALAVGCVVGIGAFVVGQRVIAGQGAPHAALLDPGVLRAVVGTGLYLALVGVLGVAVGTIVRATAGALAVIVTVTLLVPAFVPALPESWARFLGRWWPTMAGRQIMAVQHEAGAELGPWAGLGVLAAAVGLTLGAAFVLFGSRDA